MSENSITIPRIATLGLYDFKLKHGSAIASDRRPVRSYELELPTCDGGISYIDDEEYPIEHNRFICAKPGQWRRTKAPFNCLYIHIIPDNGEICRALDQLPNTIKLKNREKYIALFDEIIAEYNNTAHNTSLMLYGKFLMIIHELQLDSQTNANPVVMGKEVNAKAIGRALKYIDENYMNKITLNDLAQEVFLSPIYFRKLFFDSIGMTPYDYILDKRIEKTKQLLATTNIAIADIAISCGFSDQAYFGKVFKSVTGYTPLGYRKSINEQYP